MPRKDKSFTEVHSMNPSDQRVYGHHIAIDPTKKHQRSHVLTENCWCNPTRPTYRD